MDRDNTDVHKKRILKLKKEKKKNEVAVIINDTIRLITVYGIVHVLQSTLHEKESLFNTDFIQTMIYFIIGTIIYHLIIKQLALFDDDM
jgi:hypothetical protein